MTPLDIAILTKYSAANHMFALQVSVNGLRMTVFSANLETLRERVVDLNSHTPERFDVVLYILR